MPSMYTASSVLFALRQHCTLYVDGINVGIDVEGVNDG